MNTTTTARPESSRPIRLLLPDAVVLEHTVAVGAGVVVDGDTIAAVGTATVDAAPERLAGVLLPGLVDLQVNGAGGRTVDEATADALDTIAAAVHAGGASAFLPTLITAPFDELLEQAHAVADWIANGQRGAGAEALGLHLEGPFLDASGAHDDSLFVDPTPARVDALLAATRGTLRLVTLAPARRGAAAAVARLRAAGVAVSIGHAAACEGFADCVAAGAGLATHLFNAMSPLHHREPGIAGLALDTDALRCSLIADGVHVHAVMVRNAFRCLGVDRTVLVTDAMAAAGMPDGEYPLGTIRATVRDGIARDERGRLAGSALTMARAVHNFATIVGDVGPWTLARVAAGNPAAVIGEQRYGAIAAGRAARFALLDPVSGAITALR